MSETHEPAAPESHDTHGDHSATVKMYMAVFGALVVFTLISFVANSAARSEAISVGTSFTIILAVAVVKALLVAMFFMHLKFDWIRVYMIIIPALILGPLLVIVLLPDIVFAWRMMAG